jgi:ribosomal protein S18 acetylase RimI-like enzyme
MIEAVEEITEELMTAFDQLLPQLSPNAARPVRRALEQILASPQTTLFIARDPEQGGAVVGTATLIMFQTIHSLHARIEDVVVDERARGKGFGAALTQACVQAATRSGANDVSLTCRPDRAAANRLYRRIGFTQLETNVYYYPITGPV